MPGTMTVWLKRDELLALGPEIGIPPGTLRMLTGAECSLTAQSGEAALRSSTDRCLATRTADGRVEVDSSAAAVLRLVTAPGMTVRLDETRRGTTSSVFWYVTPALAIECRGEGTQVYVFESFPPADLVVRIAAAARLRGQDSLSGSPAAVPADLAIRAGRPADADEIQTVYAALAPKIGEGAAEAVTNALACSRASYCVSSYYRPAPGRVEGGLTSWLDAGEAGLWLTESQGGDDGSIRVEPVSAERVVTEILSGLPAS